MSPNGRPKGEYRSAKHAGFPVRPSGRPKGETPPGGAARSARGAP